MPPGTLPPDLPLDLPDAPRLALLSGASRGLGAALKAALGREGFRVVEFSRRACGPDAVALDLARPEQAAGAVRTALQGLDHSAPIDLIVLNNAATLQPIGPAWRQPPHAVQDSLATNLAGAIAWIAAIQAQLQDTPGRKVLAQISSAAAHRPHPGLSLYAAAKAGMEQFMRVLAAEQQDERHPFVPVCLDPGALDTGMQAQLRGAAPGDLRHAADFVARRPQLRDPADAAAAIVATLRAPHLAAGACLRLEAPAPAAAAPAPFFTPGRSLPHA